MMNRQYNKFDMAFTQQAPLIDRMSYNNTNNTLHNNLNENLLNERVVEYRLIFNSKDRNISLYPSEFNFKASFNGSGDNCSIDRKFANIKYISLNNVWVPKTNMIDFSNVNLSEEDYDIYPKYVDDRNLQTPDLYNLSHKPYLLLTIPELNDNHQFGSSMNLTGNSFMLVADQRIGDQYIFKPKRHTIIYPNSLLKNMNALTFRLTDNNSKQLTLVNEDGNNVIGKNISPDIPYDINQYFSNFKDINSYTAYTYDAVQIIYDFTFGVIENELATQTNYNKI